MITEGEKARVLEARSGTHGYPVEVGEVLPARLLPLVAGRDRVALVSCARVARTAFARRIATQLRREAELAVVHLLPDGEKGKTLPQIEKAAGQLLQAGLTRGSLVVALGGGAVTDAAGFLAATFMRGVDWVALPTTLLSMVDAAIGGKTGVNLPLAKNAVGAFHPPLAVLSDPSALRTLPERELRSGFGEVLKYGAIRPSLLDELAGCARVCKASVRLVADCARVKIEVVEADPREKGQRKLLNLGHTFGHGVEAAGRFSRYKHGEAVAVGLAFAFRLAHRLGRVGDGAVAKVEEALVGARLPVRVPAGVARRARALMEHDKKRVTRGLLWVLPRSQGVSWQIDWDVEADNAAVNDTLREIEGPT